MGTAINTSYISLDRSICRLASNLDQLQEDSKHRTAESVQDLIWSQVPHVRPNGACQAAIFATNPGQKLLTTRTV